MKPPRPLVPETVGVLRPLVVSGVLEAGEVAVADALTRAHGAPPDPGVIQAVAVAALARRLGHSCVDLAAASVLCGTATDPTEATVALPEPASWIATLTASDLVAIDTDADNDWDRPLVLDPELGRLWLARYAHYEHTLAGRLIDRAGSGGSIGDTPGIEAAVESAFSAHDGDPADPQHTAVVSALRRRLSFIVGGPGTGKTWTVGRLLDAIEALAATGDEVPVALAAPTGKAAERLTEAVDGRLHATTIHSLLGLHPGAPVGIDPPRKLTERLVVVDEASMIDLTLMTKLVGALTPDAHVVFVGDPDQLLSVDVGSVLRDVVDAAVDEASPLHGTVTELDRSHRFAGDLADLADAVRVGAGGRVVDLLTDPGRPALTLVSPDDPDATKAVFDEVRGASQKMVDAAIQGRAGDALVQSRTTKVLTATRAGRLGLAWWNERLGAAMGFRAGEWKPGRPVLVTRNDSANGVSNGDTGVVVPDAHGTSAVDVAFAGADEVRRVTPSRIRSSDDWWAMTVHKSQGSEFGHVIVSLPEVPSPILTRELLYTAVTRAKQRVTIVGRPELVRAAAERRVERASGLRERLSGG